MKNGLIIWNVILSLVVGLLLFLQFGSKKGNGSGTKKVTGDSTNQSNQFRIAYFEMDSVAANFDLVKELKTELTTREETINAEMTNRTKTLQQKIKYQTKQDKASQLYPTTTRKTKKRRRCCGFFERLFWKSKQPDR